MIKLALKILGGLFLFIVMCGVVLAFKPIKPTVSVLKPRASTQYWTMSGGYNIAFTQLASSNPETLVPVVFLHGGPGGYVHSSLFDVLEPIRAAGFTVFLYDQSGTGLSSRRQRPKDTTVDANITDLFEIIDQHIGADQVVLIGHSNGGNIAARFAAYHPERVAGIILSSPGDIFPARFDSDGNWLNESLYPVPDNLNFIDTSPTYAEDTSIKHLPFRALVSLATAQLLNVKFAPDRELDDALNTLIAGFIDNMVCDPANLRPEEGGGGAYSRAGANFYPDNFQSHREKLRMTQVPAIVLHGQCDFLPYAATYEYVDLLPNAEYKFVKGAGHIIYWDNPQLYAELILKFLKDNNQPS